MRLIFHGLLREKFGDHCDMQSTSVADAIEGFSRQVEVPAGLIVEVIDFETEEKLRAETDVTEVHLMPAMAGGGGKFGSIIIGALTVVAGILLLGTPFGVPLIVSGGLMILQGVVALFLQAPKTKSVNDPEASKYLAINKNTTASGTPITMAWGIIDLAGHWLSLQSDSNNIAYGSFPANPT